MVSIPRVRNVRSTAFFAHSLTCHGPPGVVGAATRMHAVVEQVDDVRDGRRVLLGQFARRLL